MPTLQIPVVMLFTADHIASRSASKIRSRVTRLECYTPVRQQKTGALAN